jgi:hypothetical protein
MNCTTDAANPSGICWPLHPFVQCGMESTEGLIVVKINGEGRGVTCRVVMPTENYETKHRS